MHATALASGAGPTVVLDGKRTTVQGRTVRHYGQIESEILSQRPSLFDLLRELAKRLDPDVCRAAFPGVIRDQWTRVTSDQSWRWLHTHYGTVFGVWLAVRHEGYTFEEIAEIVLDGKADVDAIEAAVEQASGEDEITALQWIAGEEKQAGTPPNWHQVYRRMSEKFGFGPEVVDNMTIPRIRQYWDKEDSLDEDTPLAGFDQRRHRDIDRAIENILEGKRWESRR